MKILNADQIRKVDTFTIDQEPIASVDLMERASRACVDWILGQFGTPLSVKIFAGPGNNGGDGLAIARMLAESQNDIEVFILSSVEKMTAECFTNYKRLIDHRGVNIVFLEETQILPNLDEGDIIVDALFGYGLSRPLAGQAARIVRHINMSASTVISIDMPSGLFPEKNNRHADDDVVKASFTLSFQFPKLSFFCRERNICRQLEGSRHSSPSCCHRKGAVFLLLHGSFRYYPSCKKRNKFSHKGIYGHALLLAGSYGKMGAAVLASKACLKSGVGLFTARIVSKGYDIIQTAVPEAMVSIDPSAEYLSTIPELNMYSAVGIGPGIGTGDYSGLLVLQMIQKVKVPMVIDADGLNLIAKNQGYLEKLALNTILTPHPGEFDRLFGTSPNGYERHLKQIEFSKRYKIIIILKGAYTSVTNIDGACFFNSTGNPGMATAGSGDVLTGIVLSLLAQGYQPFQAALTGVYLHGLAGDLACRETGEEALIASDIIKYIGKAFLTLKRKL